MSLRHPGLSTQFDATVTVAGQHVPVAATLRVDGSGVEITTATGASRKLAFGGLTLEAGGFEGDFVFIRPADRAYTVASSAPGLVDALREAGGSRVETELGKIDRHARKRSRGKWIGAGALVTLAVLLGAGLWSVPAILAATVAQLPASIDRTVGDAAFSSLTLGPRVTDSSVTGFVDEIVTRLSRAAGPDFALRVVVVRDEGVNAFALPGGQIVVQTGLLEKARTAEQVAGVLAHEVAHVVRRHGLRNIAHSASVFLAVQLLFGDLEGWAGLGVELGTRAQQNGYSRDQERDADEQGVRLLAEAAIDPSGLAGFFEAMKAEPASELTGPLNWFSTHPAHDERIATVHQRIRALGLRTYQPLAADFQAVKAALGGT